MRFDPEQAKICEEFYGDAFHSFEALMTVPVGLFKLLENKLGDIEGRQLLCELFQVRLWLINSSSIFLA